VTDDFEEFTELVDADLPRVDVVGKGANGMPFLVAKSAFTPNQVHALINKQKEGGPVPTYKYKHRGLVITSKRRLTLGEVRTVAAQHVGKAAASHSDDIVPVYDASGKLVGTVDPAKINTFGDYPGSGYGDVVPAPADEVGQASMEVAKVAKSMFPDAPRDGSSQPSAEQQAANATSLGRRLDEIVNGLARRYGLRDEEERAIAKQAVVRAFAGSHAGTSPAAQALAQAHAARAAAGAIERHRAGRR